MTFSMIVYVCVLREGQKCNILLTDKMTTKISLVHQAFFSKFHFLSLYTSHFTTRKQSFGQGDVFTTICQSFCSWGGGSLYDVTSYLAAGPKFLLGVSVPV